LARTAPPCVPPQSQTGNRIGVCGLLLHSLPICLMHTSGHPHPVHAAASWDANKRRQCHGDHNCLAMILWQSPSRPFGGSARAPWNSYARPPIPLSRASASCLFCECVPQVVWVCIVIAAFACSAPLLDSTLFVRDPAGSWKAHDSPREIWRWLCCCDMVFAFL
jgi:hypothetical protein